MRAAMSTTYILPDLPWTGLLPAITKDARAGDRIVVHTAAMPAVAQAPRAVACGAARVNAAERCRRAVRPTGAGVVDRAALARLVELPTAGAGGSWVPHTPPRLSHQRGRPFLVRYTRRQPAANLRSLTIKTGLVGAVPSWPPGRHPHHDRCSHDLWMTDFDRHN